MAAIISRVVGIGTCGRAGSLAVVAKIAKTIAALACNGFMVLGPGAKETVSPIFMEQTLQGRDRNVRSGLEAYNRFVASKGLQA
jgi:hypothetical protein